MIRSVIDYFRISSAKVFDGEYYAAKYSGFISGTFPLLHYCLIGWRNGANPHPFFQTSYYLEKNPDVRTAGINPLLHWLFSGLKEGRNPSPDFVVKEYKALYKNEKQYAENPICDASQRKRVNQKTYTSFYQYDADRLIGSTLFDSEFYVRKYPDVKLSGTNPLAHFLLHGCREGRLPSDHIDKDLYMVRVFESNSNPIPVSDILLRIHQEMADRERQNREKVLLSSGIFDESYYLEKYKAEVSRSGLTASEHFLSEGWKKRNNPSKEFNTGLYLHLFPDIVDTDECPVFHYVRNKKKLSAAKFNLLEFLVEYFQIFDEHYYALNNQDVVRSRLNPLTHFVESGWKEGRNPSADFSIQSYCKQYLLPDEQTNPILHFIQFCLGVDLELGLKCSVPMPDELVFNASYYRKQNPDVANVNILPATHFFNHGIQEGRSPNQLLNLQFYLELNSDIGSTGANPYLHYIMHGRAEHRRHRRTMDVNSLVTALQPAPKTADPSTPVSIVLPIYNGYDYLVTLLPQLLENTVIPFKLIAVNDCSPDERIQPLLEEFMPKFQSQELIVNTSNLGFVSSVNAGLAKSTGDVVILNSDVALPGNWLSRLMAPIWSDETIASVTPMTNAGTIASFPETGKDNPIFMDMDVEEIDSVFSRFSPLVTFDCPTGVGFCMGMSRKALDWVGALDDETFKRGYGEENDWCRRAAEAGFRNVLLPGLFVWHKHGGSFTSKEKALLIEQNLKALVQKHPNYLDKVRQHFATDAIAPHRFYAFAELTALKSGQGILLVIDHALGGGANLYRKKRVEKEELKRPVLLLTYNHQYEAYEAKLSFSGKSMLQYFESYNDLFQVLRLLDLKEVFYNNIVSFPDPLQLIDTLKDLVSDKQAKLIVTIHDYYPICQSFTLLNSAGIYCGTETDAGVCNACISKNARIDFQKISITQWRATWKSFMDIAEDIICFSNSSEKILSTAYPDLDKSRIHVIPHTLPEEVKPLHIGNYSEIHVGVLGTINYHKGGDVVRNLVKFMDETGQGRLTIVGEFDGDPIHSTRFSKTGKYNHRDLAGLIQSRGINVFLFPSVWPETFSYVTDELIAMGVDLVAFDLGAPAERISVYKRGKILPVGSSSEDVFRALKSAFDESRKQHFSNLRQTVEESNLFDPNYYLEHHPDIKATNIDPLDHYLMFGGFEGRNPSYYFDTGYYLRTNPDVKQAGVHPLVHYLLNGRAEGRLPKPNHSAQLYPDKPIIPKGLKVAVLIHAYYADLIPELLDYTLNLPLDYTVLMSVVSEEGEEAAQKWALANNFDKLTVKLVPNRGRDIAPAFIGFRDEVLNFDLVCKIHSKKSLYTGAEQSDWRRELIYNLLGTRMITGSILTMFSENDRLGLVYPISGLLPYWAYTWLSNKGIGYQLQAKLGIDLQLHEYVDYPMGSMFWFRPDALKQLLSSELSLADFAAEPCGNDGTFAHAIERAFVPVSSHHGYTHIELNFMNSKVAQGFGSKNFEQYTRLGPADLWKKIDENTTISFDIFDTLISRKILYPDFVFELLESELDHHAGSPTNFKSIRKQAEARARQKLGTDVNYDQIYRVIQEDNLLPPALEAIARQREFERELEFTMPRVMMREAFRYAVSKEKRVLLVSDMYLTKSQIDQLLEANEIEGYSKFYLSNEEDKRKDSGTLWDLLLKEEITDKSRFLHIGDNEHSDIQQVVDRGLNWFHILSPLNMFKNSSLGLNYTVQYPEWHSHVFLGPVVSRMYNNPFVQRDTMRIDPVFETPRDTGYCVYGPVILAYFRWLIDESKKDGMKALYFLAREGHLLKDMYDHLAGLEQIRTAHGQLPESNYLLCSRRAVMGAVQKDLPELIQIVTNNHFDGTFGDLLFNRVGVDISKSHKAMAETQIRLHEDDEKVVEMLKLVYDDIAANTVVEGEAYLDYLNAVGLLDEERVGLVDVGYSGTIQRYLHKMTAKPMTGYYFLTRDTTASWETDNNEIKGYFGDKIGPYSEVPLFKFNLYHEFWLSSPDGQLSHFKKLKNGFLPVFRDKDPIKALFSINEEIAEGAKQYITDAVALCNGNLVQLNLNQENAQAIFEHAVRADLWDSETRRIAYLEDSFCGRRDSIDVIGDYKKYVL